MTRYADFEKLAEITKMVKTARGYAKFVQTGSLSINDYGRGFVDLDIYSFVDYKKVPQVRLWFGTIDDEDFGGWLACESKEQADELVERIANEIFRDMVAFPTIEELNEDLKIYGIKVGYE